MELLAYTDGDLALTEALETDPLVMSELGGPIDRSCIPEIHRRRLGDPWWFKIALVPQGPAVGTIGIWEKVLNETTIHETGWLVLPAFQGRGGATAALGLLIDRVRAEPRFESMHAFPAVTNVPSNALCRRFHFELVGQRDFAYAGTDLRCNHWALATPVLANSTQRSPDQDAHGFLSPEEMAWAAAFLCSDALPTSRARRSLSTAACCTASELAGAAGVGCRAHIVRRSRPRESLPSESSARVLSSR